MMATDAGFRETLAYNCGPLFMDALKNPEVIEIMLNPDGMLWIERYGQDQEPIGTMEPVRSRAVLSLVASALDLTVNDHSPIIEGEFPLDGSRFEATFPPIVSAPSFSLRKKASKVMSVEDYVADGVITPAVVPFLEHAVVTRKNIMVVGGTSSGKTTFVNAIIQRIALLCPSHRLLILEDTAELQSQRPNTVPRHWPGWICGLWPRLPCVMLPGVFLSVRCATLPPWNCSNCGIPDTLAAWARFTRTARKRRCLAWKSLWRRLA